MDIKRSLKYGWEKLVETWWWITLAAMYMPIGGALYFLTGFTASRWANNPDILGALNYDTFSSFLKSPINLKSYIGYVVTAFVMLSIVYLFAGYIPSKRAANKHHNSLMFKTTLVFFVFNAIFALFSYLAVALSSKQPNLFSFNMLLSQYFAQTASYVFGTSILILIAIISYIYEKFTMKNVFQLIIIYFITGTLEFLLVQPVMFKTMNGGQMVMPRVIPLLGIITTTIDFALIIIAIFVSVETVIQDNLSEGTKRGLHLLWVRSSILWTYFLVWAIVFLTTFIVQYFVILSYRLTHIMPSVLSSSMAATIAIIVASLGDAYILFATFKLARIFENRENAEEVSMQTADAVNPPNEMQV